MQVNISVDPEKVAFRLMDRSTFVDIEGDVIDGSFEETVSAVIAELTFEFDRDDAELGEVLQFPVVNA